MWVNPNHPNPPRPASSPPDPGRVLAALPRNEGRDELRVTLDTYNGRPFISVRVWERDRSGSWWPSKKGVSVRLSEAEDVAGALVKALDPEEASSHGS